MEMIFAVLGMIWGVGLLAVYRIGLRDGRAISAGKDLPKAIPRTGPSADASVPDERTQTILDNIDAYDGTDAGQKDVK